MLEISLPIPVFDAKMSKKCLFSRHIAALISIYFIDEKIWSKLKGKSFFQMKSKFRGNAIFIYVHFFKYYLPS